MDRPVDTAAEVLGRWRREVRKVLAGADPDLIEEVEQHVTERWLSVRAAGASSAAADEQVRRDLVRWRTVGQPHGQQPARRPSLAQGWIADAIYAVRALKARPLFSLASVLLTSVAVAGTVATFAVAYGILIRPLPYPEASRLAVVWQIHRGQRQQVSFPDYADLAALPVFDASTAMIGGQGSLRVDDRIHRVNLLELEAPGYAMLGAVPVHGRLLHAGDGGRPNVMISYRLWSGALRQDPQAIGRVVWLSGRDYTIVGVLPQGFDFELPVTSTFRLADHDLWAVLDRSAPFIDRRDVSTYEVLVRRAPGASLDEARAAVDARSQQLAADHAATNAGRTFDVAPLHGTIVGGAKRPLLLTCLAAAAALTIALANLGTLLLARFSERRAELAIRLALGAGTLRLRRQFFTENAIVAAAGLACGTALASALVRLLTTNEAVTVPRASGIYVDTPVWAFAAVVALLIAGVLTVVPLRLGDSAAALHAGARVTGRHGRSARRALVAVEIALAIALAAGGTLFGLSLSRLFAVDPGFASPGVATARVSAYPAWHPSRDHVQAFFAAVVERIQATPGIERAAAGSSLPLSGQSTGTEVVTEGHPVDSASREGAGWQFVTPGYFAALGIPFHAGRDFVAEDLAHERHVTIVNEDLARALFGDGEALGRRIALGGGDRSNDWHEIIGVVASVRHHALDRAPSPRVYDLFGQHWGRTLYVVAKSRTEDPSPALSSIRHVVAVRDPVAPVFEISSMAALVARSAAPYSLAAMVSAGLAVCALLLALIGVYAVAAASGAERRHEIGLRAALGASRRDLMRLVLTEGLQTSAIGAAGGIAAAVALARLLRAQLFGLDGGDATVIVPVVCALILVVAVAATLPAAIRAAGADPLVAMRAE
jgi:predicted permease